MTKSTLVRKREYARAVAWFVELTRAYEHLDRDRELLARRQLRDLGFAVRLTADPLSLGVRR